MLLSVKGLNLSLWKGFFFVKGVIKSSNSKLGQIEKIRGKKKQKQYYRYNW